MCAVLLPPGVNQLQLTNISIYERPSFLMQLATDFKDKMKLCVLKALEVISISVSPIPILEDVEVMR